MNFKDLKDYIPYVINMNTDNIKAVQLPGTSDDYLNGISFFLHDEEETKELVNELYYGITLEETEEE